MLLQLSTLSSMLTIFLKVVFIPEVPADLLLWLGAVLLVGSDAFGLLFVASSLFWLPDDGGMATVEPITTTVPLTLPSALLLWQLLAMWAIPLITVICGPLSQLFISPLCRKRKQGQRCPSSTDCWYVQLVTLLQCLCHCAAVVDYHRHAHCLHRIDSLVSCGTVIS